MNNKYTDEYVRLGINITLYRKLAGFNQEKLAEKLNIEPAHLSRIENARVGVSLDVLFAMAEILEIPIYKLFEFRD